MDHGGMSPKRARIVWTAGWVEPGDSWMMVTIIHFSVAPPSVSFDVDGDGLPRTSMSTKKLIPSRDSYSLDIDVGWPWPYPLTNEKLRIQPDQLESSF